jgi:hypothetical protein
MALRAAALLLVLLALAACGGGGEEEGGVAAATTAGAATTGSGSPATTEADDYTRGGGTATGGGETLEGSVGPGFEISLDGTDGLGPGTYTLEVDDRAPEHNFHLTGPGGVDVSTSVGGEGEESFEVTLEPGEYTFLCDPHASSMRGTFTVG